MTKYLTIFWAGFLIPLGEFAKDKGRISWRQNLTPVQNATKSSHR